MAQLVFVHGVATRGSQAYHQKITEQNTLFQELMFRETKVEIHSPIWGDIVPPIRPDVFKTDQGVQTYSLNVAPATALGGGLAGGGGVDGVSTFSIGEVGKQDPVAALDAICSQIADGASAQGRPLTAEELHTFRKAADLIASNSAETVFAGDVTAAAIAERLKADAPGSFGIGSFVRDAISAVTNRIRHAASTLGFGAVRDSLSPAVGLFIGDVFVYLKQGEHRTKIQRSVGAALTAAYEAAKADGGPLVVVGHSMGGVILVDMLANPAAAGLPTDIRIDALLTVGSQPGLFASVDVLTRDSSTETYRRPECVRHWLNVFDPIDPLAFRTDMVFAHAEDLAFNSVAGITDTHSKYFQRPQFFARSRARLQEEGIL
jgi:hypothetical protein